MSRKDQMLAVPTVVRLDQGKRILLRQPSPQRIIAHDTDVAAVRSKGRMGRAT